MSAGEPSELRRSVDLRRCRRFFFCGSASAQSSSVASSSSSFASCSSCCGVKVTCLSHSSAGLGLGSSEVSGGAGDASVFALGGGAGRTSSLFGAGDGGASTVSVMVRSDSLSCAGSDAGTPSALSQAVSNSTTATTPKGMR